MSRVKKRKQSEVKIIKDSQWYGENGNMVELERKILAIEPWGNFYNPLMQEFVAREHIEGGMPISQLANCHGIPASRIRKWISIYQTYGRSGFSGKPKEPIK